MGADDQRIKVAKRDWSFFPEPGSDFAKQNIQMSVNARAIVP
jgi:hypothetical protein